ncbi:non-specific lipid-transfer protein AP10-like [Rutidosis leptorrhynchoides]|uniref:non-specific lipid-transfer protein AP10-like n=1 Tax=Rutidosis leptorrhynchoides TaxID=125765 RepID=UPI003A98F343
MKGVVIVVVTTLAMVGFMVHPSESITCLDVDGFLAPCLPCLRQGGEPPKECCNGLKGLEAACRTKSDRQIACNCCKTAAITFQIREQFAEVLPDKCGVHISIPISPTVDCSSVSFYEQNYYKLHGSWILPGLVE